MQEDCVALEKKVSELELTIKEMKAPKPPGSLRTRVRRSIEMNEAFNTGIPRKIPMSESKMNPIQHTPSNLAKR